MKNERGGSKSIMIFNLESRAGRTSRHRGLPVRGSRSRERDQEQAWEHAGPSSEVSVITEDRASLELIFQNLSEGILAQDPKGRLLYANDAAARITGFCSTQEMLSLSVAEVF